MTNSTYIKENYKSSTIARLADYGYDTEESINFDPDMTMVLGKLKAEGNTNQQDLLDSIYELQQEFYTMMEEMMNQKKESIIEEVLWDFQEKITPRLKARMMKTPLLELKGKLEKLRTYYLNEYAKS